MSDHLIKKLMAFGMSDKESRIYLALLELGAATVAEAAKQSGVNRSSAYVVLEMLKKKGLAGTSDDKKVRRYVAASPETVLHIAKSTAKKQQDIKEDLEATLPELRALHKNTKHRPIVKVYEGRNGLREVYWDVLYTKGAKDLKTFSNPITMFKMFPDFMEQVSERIKKKIKMFAICPLTKETSELSRNAPPFDEIIVIPENKFKNSNNVAIYGNKIALASPGEEFGIIIESQEMADALRTIFDLSWQEAKRINKENKIKLF